MAEQLDIESVFKLKVDELKVELTKRGLAKSGSKSDLQERLLQYVTNKSYTEEYKIAPDTSVGEEDLSQDTSDTLEETLDKSNTSEVFDKTDNLENCLDKTEPVDSKDVDDEDIIDTPNDDDGPETCDVNGDNVDIIVSPEKSDVSDNVKTTYDIDLDIDDKDSKITDTSDVNQTKVSKVKIVSLPISNGDRKESRSKRFGGASSETEKKKARLGRFFSSVSGLGKGEPVTEEDVEKIKKRAERFGAVSTILTQPVDSSADRLKQRQERFADSSLKKRQERFGVVQKQSLNMSDLNADMSVRKQNRLAKFGTL